jgi:acetyl-CoA carboxylase carboxyltransferase component
VGRIFEVMTRASGKIPQISVVLGPAAGGLVVVDLEALEIVTAFDPDVVRANCGVQVTADGAKVYTCTEEFGRRVVAEAVEGGVDD